MDVFAIETCCKESKVVVEHDDEGGRRSENEGLSRFRLFSGRETKSDRMKIPL